VGDPQRIKIEIAVDAARRAHGARTFYRTNAAPVRPYHVSPWQGEKLDISVPVLVPIALGISSACLSAAMARRIGANSIRRTARSSGAPVDVAGCRVRRGL